MSAQPLEAAFWVPLGRALREARQQRRLSIMDLSKRIGYSRSMISQVENGKNRMTADRLFALCDYLGVDIHEAIDRRPPKVCSKCGGEGVV